MKRATAAFVITLCIGLAACGESTTAPTSEELVGLWVLPYRPTPTVFGYVSAQVIFREDRTFLFVGTNPLSSGPMAEFTVTGTWVRDENVVALTTGDTSRSWTLDFARDGVDFTDPDSGETFRLLHLLPD